MGQNKMTEVTNVITLEDGIDYAVIDEIKHNENTYIYLTNINDYEDFCIRKILVENNEQFIVGLDDDKEFDLALMLFAKNHKDEIGTIY